MFVAEPLLYAITDPDLIPRNRFLSVVEAALEAGVGVLQLRDKRATDAELLPLARDLKTLCENFGVPLIINDRLDLAERVGAGVHLGERDASVSEARARLGPDALVGSSCYGDISSALRAREQGASYVAFGPVFSTPLKPDTPAVGLEILDRARTKLSFPFAAIGGIDETNIARVARREPWAVCVIRAVFGRKDPGRAAARLRELLEQANETPGP